MTVLDLNYNFASLSLRDLLEARDAYHFHLLSKQNVVGTAVGLYLIRKDEPWPSRTGEGKNPPGKKTYARTLTNSEVRDYSWPCVLAFVRSWATEEDFGTSGRYDATQIVPKTLYLPDGRAVPVCVVEAPPVPSAEVEAPAIGPRPAAVLGGGCPILVESQGEWHQATAGCLVSDGHTTYALTARHACGEPGDVIYSALREGPTRIGQSSPKQLTRLPFPDVYPEFVGRRSYVALDAGLVRVDTVADWTSNTYGLPRPGPLADLHEGNLSLRLIDQPLVGYGAASGLLFATVKALFYRHRSVGGYDYVGDFLIAPGEGAQVRAGDSGMVWHLDVTKDIRQHPETPLALRDLRPLAMEWGGQVFDEQGARSTFAIATSLSNVCKLLDVELVTDVGRSVVGYWGRTGHYSIAALAINLIRDAKLKKLMKANAEILSFELSAIAEKGFDKSVGQLSMADKFVPLADVPDEIWKKLPKSRGGRTGGRDVSGGGSRSNGPEHPTHYADIDAKYPPHGKSLGQLCREDPLQFLTVPAWLKYYRDMAKNARDEGDEDAAREFGSSLKQGLLPFRLWQFFDAMKGFVADGDIEGYVTAAGISAHYMGDASQPLHGSVMADGDKSRPSPRRDPETGEPFPLGKGVHSAYETNMVSRFATTLLPAAEKILKNGGAVAEPPLADSGVAVARAVIELMHDAAKIVSPTEIIEVFEDSGGSSRVADLDAMFETLGEPTAKLLALGAQYLAMLWDSAWREGGGGSVAPSKLQELRPKDVRKRYIDKDFVPSLVLKDLEGTLQ